ncbi:MAG: AI-2E family transporter [Deltaproteobacteria bacterium]
MEAKNKYIKIGVIVSLLVISAVVYFIFANSAKIAIIITPFIIGIIIAYLLNPLIIRLEKRKVSRGLAITLIGILFLIITVLFLNMIIPVLYSNITDLISNIPDYTKYYNNLVTWVQTQVNYSMLPQQVKDIVASQIKGNINYLQGFFVSLLKNSLGAISSIFSFFLNFLMGIFIAFYFLKDIDFFKMQISNLIPRSWRNPVSTTSAEINVVISNYIQGQLTVLAIVAVLETIGLTIAGVKYSLVLGIIGGIANIIPYFGPFIGAVPAVAIAILDSPMKALFAILVFVIVQQIDNSIISPKIMSESMGLHPITIIFVILFFGTFFGLIGMILAVPLTAILKVIGKKILEKIV